MTPEIRVQLDALVAQGLNFGEMVNYFAEQPDQVAYRHYIDKAFDANVVEDGVCEIGDPGIVSYGADNGAYVMAWVWVEDEEAEEDEE